MAAPGKPGSTVTIHSNASIAWRAGGADQPPISRGRALAQMARGSLAVSGHELRQGDGLVVKDAAALALQTDTGAKALAFDPAQGAIPRASAKAASARARAASWLTMGLG
jgi:redox-sensitive bicupin YhaK (pirin superfamily)